MSIRLWQDLSWTDFSKLPPDAVAILPTAAVEQHGPHLPLSTDTEINLGILNRTGELLGPDAPVFALPVQAVGLSVEHIRYPGTLTGSVETLLALWTEIGESVARAGVKRLLFVNSHGGQPQILDLVCRRLRTRAGMFAAMCSWGRLGLPEGLIDPLEKQHGIHGGQIETSLMLRLRPDLVRMSQARNFRSAWLDQSCAILEPEGRVGFGWETQDLNRMGALGDATIATAEIGEAIVAHAARRLAALIGEIRSFDVASWLQDTPLEA
jgi:creatinine amidohydrolase